MKINQLQENLTPASTPSVKTIPPKFGRSDEMLESDCGTTSAGSVASVSQPVGKMQRRGKGSMFAGIKTSAKYPNSAPVKEGRFNNRDAYQRDYDSSITGFGRRPREDDEFEPEYDDRMRRQTGMIFYNIPDTDEAYEEAQLMGMKRTRAGKWFLPVSVSRFTQQRADRLFGQGKVWYPKNESVNEEQLDEIFNPTTSIAHFLRAASSFASDYIPVAVGAAGTFAATTAVLGPVAAMMASSTVGTQILQTMQNQQNKVPGLVQQLIEKYFGSEQEEVEFALIHAKAAFLGQSEFRWRGKQWPVTLEKNAAEAIVEKNDKYWLEQQVRQQQQPAMAEGNNFLQQHGHGGKFPEPRKPRPDGIMSKSEVLGKDGLVYHWQDPRAKQGVGEAKKANTKTARQEFGKRVKAKPSEKEQEQKKSESDAAWERLMAYAAAQKKEQSVDEVAPPGAKAERMVKHIKAGYAKDGKLTDKEKAIAYATAWKAHNAGKVEEEGMAEASPETTFNVLKGLKTWQVVIFNNYYAGKYSDYRGRYYYVLASSPEEAKQVVIDNADGILQELLAMKSQNGKKILPRGTAVRITPERIGKIEDGTVAGRMSTAGFKKMFGPQGPMMVKLSGGAVVDMQGQEVDEADPGYNKHSFIGKIRRGREADNKGWGQLGQLFAAGKDEKAAEKALRKGNRYYNMTRGDNKTTGGFPKTTIEGQGVAEASFDYTMKDLGNDYAGFPSQHSLKHKMLAKIKPEKQQLYKDKLNNTRDWDSMFALFKVAKERGDIIEPGDSQPTMGLNASLEQHADDKMKELGHKFKAVDEEKQRLDPKCWKGYKKQGTKMKGGVRVNNCVKIDEGEANLEKALEKLHGNWSGWYPDDYQSDPDVKSYWFDDGEGGFYADGTIEHNLKTGEIKVDFKDKEGSYGDDVQGTFNSVGEVMNALRGGSPSRRNTKAPNLDTLGHREPVGPDDLYKTDKKGKIGTLKKVKADTMKASSPYRMRGGPKGVLPEGEIAEDKLANDLYKDFQIFKKGTDKGISSKAKDKEIGNKPKDKDIVAKESFNGEYDDEAGSAESNLLTTARAVRGLINTIDDRDNLPEWVQEKIAKAEQMLVTAWDYLQSQKEQGIDPELDEDWQKVNKSDNTDGMSRKAVKAYRRENPGSKLKTAVTTKPSKLKAGSKAAKRRKSFCARMSGVKGPMKDEKGRPTAKAKALRRWNC